MRLLRAATYRLSQFRASLGGSLAPEDREWVDAVLARAERPLFDRMPSYDQTHSVRVARELERAGADRVLLRAALLHDLGKTIPPHRVPLIYRGLVVLVRAVNPRLLRGVARPWGPLWPVYLHVNHPELGARELERAGSPAVLVELVRMHQEASPDPRLQLLQRVDGRH